MRRCSPRDPTKPPRVFTASIVAVDALFFALILLGVLGALFYQVTLVGLVLFVAPCVFAVALIATLWRLGLRSTWYSRHRIGLCVRCGYNLRELRADKCPECGTPRPHSNPAAEAAGSDSLH